MRNLENYNKDSKGIWVSVLRRLNGDCSANGVTSTRERMLLVGEGIAEHFSAENEDDILVYEKRIMFGEPCPCARPLKKTQDGIAGMFGGNFVYCSDDRFPEYAPIHVHDRFED